MPYRLEITLKSDLFDAEGEGIRQKAKNYFGIDLSQVSTIHVETIDANLTNKTVISGGINKAELQKYIDNHDRVIMLGHGSPMGLLSVNRFPDCNSYVIDHSMVESL
ncbi:MAG: hypothetical protein FP811_02245, partial [Desulfobacteraceae bacterium]|nr:hypothetical protein [Desulfobacteraceae bacterium]